MTFKIGDTVRVISSLDEKYLPLGTIGTVLSDPISDMPTESDEVAGDALWVEFPNHETPVLYGWGWPLFASELELVTDDELAG